MPEWMKANQRKEEGVKREQYGEDFLEKLLKGRKVTFITDEVSERQAAEYGRHAGSPYILSREIENRGCEYLQNGEAIDEDGWIGIGFLPSADVNLEANLPIAVGLYREREPSDTIIYDGWDGTGYMVRLRFSDEYLHKIREMLPDDIRKLVGGPKKTIAIDVSEPE
jgi:hypothetical protein